MPAVKEIQWGEPPEAPPGRGRPSVYPGLLEAVKTRPGEWGMVGTGGSDSAVRKAAKSATGGRFEVVSRRLPNSNGSGPKRGVWVRWLPEA